MKTTQEEAERVARAILYKIPEIAGIDIFGSIAKKGRGNDIDMFILVSDALYREWLEQTHFTIRTQTFWTQLFYYSKKYIPCFEWYTSHKKWQHGRCILYDLFGQSIEEIAKAELGRYVRIDTVLAPADWKRNGSRLQNDFGLSQGTINFYEINKISIISIAI